MMKFETAVMRRTFDDAQALAISGQLWSSAIPTPEPLWRGLFKRQAGARRQAVKDPILTPALAAPDEPPIDLATDPAVASGVEREEPIS